jgi:hypothetical protein
MNAAIGQQAGVGQPQPLTHGGQETCGRQTPLTACKPAGTQTPLTAGGHRPTGTQETAFGVWAHL